MNKALKLVAGLLLTWALAGCIAEDYDVGVPTAILHIDAHLLSRDVPLTEANVSWDSSSGRVEETIDDIEEYALSQDEIEIFPGQDVTLRFEENEENGGDIWTDPTITAVLWKNGKEIKLDMSEDREFLLPTEEGNYIFEATFKDEENTAQYVANIVMNDDANVSSQADESE